MGWGGWGRYPPPQTQVGLGWWQKRCLVYCQKNLIPCEKIDPFKDRINVVAFDGAANVQKAADLLQEQFPSIPVMQGVHCHNYWQVDRTSTYQRSLSVFKKGEHYFMCHLFF